MNADYKNITFIELKKLYLEDTLLYSAVKTEETYRVALDKFYKLDDIPTSEIEFLDKKKIVNDAIKEGLEPYTINSYLRILKRFFNTVKDERNLYYTIINNTHIRRNFNGI